MLFLNNNRIETTTTGIEKPYLFEKFGSEKLTQAGYQITIPVQLIKDSNENQLRLFASDSSGAVAELNYNYDSKYQFFNNQKNRPFKLNSKTIKQQLIKQVADLSFSGVLNALTTDSSQFLSGDWYAINDHWRWIGKHVFLAIPHDSTNNSINIKFTAMPYIKKGITDHQTIQVLINQNTIETFKLSNNKSQQFTVNYSLPKNNQGKPILIELIMSNATAPAEIGTGSDVRKLSLFLSEFTVSYD